MVKQTHNRNDIEKKATKGEWETTKELHKAKKD